MQGNQSIEGAQAPIRYVVLHLPGTAWRWELSPLEQPGLADHLRYMHAAFAAGIIELSGPFLDDDAGGMVIMSGTCSEQEALRLAQEDPGVQSNLIRAEVRPWMTTFTRKTVAP